METGQKLTVTIQIVRYIAIYTTRAVLANILFPSAHTTLSLMHFFLKHHVSENQSSKITAGLTNC